MKPIIKTILIVFYILIIAPFVFWMAGCVNLKPIDTRLSYEMENGRRLKYKSQKDLTVVYPKFNFSSVLLITKGRHKVHIIN